MSVLALIVLAGDRRGILRTARELDGFDGDDRRWLRRKRAPQGRFNAGQKLNTALTAAFTVLFLVTGLLLWFGERNTSLRFASTVVVHDGLMYVSLVLLVGHLYLAVLHPATRHALRGITVGTVGERWAADTTRNGSRNDDRPRRRRRADRARRHRALPAPRRLHDARGRRRRRAPRLIETADPEFVVLDVMLPGTDGLELCRWIRSRSDLPVIMLTARGEEADRIVGLELGADDYVTKPFSPRELRGARADGASALSGAPPARSGSQFGDVVLDGASREVTRAGAPVTLTAREFDLLWFLASHPRHVFSRDHLMDRVWGHAVALDTGTVTVHIRRLREKIEADPARPARLQTVWGVGYRFDP